MKNQQIRSFKNALKIAAFSLQTLTLANIAIAQVVQDGYRAGTNRQGDVEIKNKNNKAIKFNTNNTQRLLIDSIGRVGINTNNPSAFLDVNGKINTSDSLIAKNIRFNNSVLASGSATTDSVLTIDGNGNVRRLNPGSVSKNLTLTSKSIWVGDVTNKATELVVGANGKILGVDASGNVNWVSPSSVTPSVGKADTLNILAGRTGKVAFFNGTANRLDSADALSYSSTNGSLGIGTTSPTAKLDVAGKIKTNDTLEAKSIRLSSALASGSAITDSIVTIDAAGNLRKVNVNSISPAGTLTTSNILNSPQKDSIAKSIANSLSANSQGLRDTLLNNVARNLLKVGNGLSKGTNSDSIILGGTLNQPTIITTTANNTLAFAGLQTANVNDSNIITSNADGVIKKLRVSELLSSIGVTTISIGSSISPNTLGGNGSIAGVTTTLNPNPTYDEYMVTASNSVDNVQLPSSATIGKILTITRNASISNLTIKSTNTNLGVDLVMENQNTKTSFVFDGTTWKKMSGLISYVTLSNSLLTANNLNSPIVKDSIAKAIENLITNNVQGLKDSLAKAEATSISSNTQGLRDTILNNIARNVNNSPIKDSLVNTVSRNVTSSPLKDSIAKAVAVAMFANTSSLRDSVSKNLNLTNKNIWVGNASNKATELAVGAIGRVLGVDASGNVNWVSPSSVTPSVGKADTLTVLPGRAGKVSFFNGTAGRLDSADALSYSSTNGSLGIGTTTPTAKLDVAGKINTNDSLVAKNIRLNNAALASGSATTDSILTIDANGNVKRINPSSITPTGVLTITNIANSPQKDSIAKTVAGSISANTQGLRDTMLNNIARNVNNIPLKDSLTSVVSRNLKVGNGLSKGTTNDSVILGGTLSKATSITTTSANTLALSGLQSGTTTDSILSIDATSGVIKRRSVSSITPTDVLTSSNIANSPQKDSIAKTVAGSISANTQGLRDTVLNNVARRVTTSPLSDSIARAEAISINANTQGLRDTVLNNVARRVTTSPLRDSIARAEAISINANTQGLRDTIINNVSRNVTSSPLKDSIAKAVAVAMFANTSSLRDSVSKNLNLTNKNIWVGNASNKATELAVGATGRVLGVDASGNVNWVSPSSVTPSVGKADTLTVLPGRAGKVSFFNGTSGRLDSADALSYSSTNGSLGIGTTSPTAKLDVAGKINTNDSLVAKNIRLNNTALASGSATTDSILTIDANGNVKRINPSTISPAGVLTATNIANSPQKDSIAKSVALSINANTQGLRDTVLNNVARNVNNTPLKDSLVSVVSRNLKVGNGLSKGATNDSVLLGGTLSKATTITTTTTNTLALTGLSNTNDATAQVLSIDTISGVIGKKDLIKMLNQQRAIQNNTTNTQSVTIDNVVLDVTKSVVKLNATTNITFYISNSNPVQAGTKIKIINMGDGTVNFIGLSGGIITNTLGLEVKALEPLSATNIIYIVPGSSGSWEVSPGTF